MCCLDFPFFRIEVIGACADVLDKSEGTSFKAYGDESARRLFRQHEGFVAQIGNGLLVSELDRKLSFLMTIYSQRGNILFPAWECFVPSVGIISMLPALQTFSYDAHKETFST